MASRDPGQARAANPGGLLIEALFGAEGMGPGVPQSGGHGPGDGPRNGNGNDARKPVHALDHLLLGQADVFETPVAIRPVAIRKAVLRRCLSTIAVDHKG